MSNRSGPFVRGGLVAWAIGGLAVSLVLILACGGGFLVWRGRGMPGLSAAVTDTPSPTATSTRSPTRTATPAPSRTPTATVTQTPRGTARPSRTPMGDGVPTPIMCNDPQDLARQEIAPGQEFSCTFSEDDLNSELSKQTDVPCTRLTVLLADGQIQLTCLLGFRLTAVVEVKANNCRLDAAVVDGTPGFTDAVQTMLEETDALFPYGQICIQEVTVGDGEIVISGYGR